MGMSNFFQPIKYPENYIVQLKCDKEFFYVLGMFWGAGSHLDSEKVLVRHANKSLVEYMASKLNVTTSIYRPTTEDEAWAFRISPNHPFFIYVKSLGWTGKKVWSDIIL